MHSAGLTSQKGAALTPQEQRWLTGFRSLSKDIYGSEYTLHKFEGSPEVLVPGSRIRLRVLAAANRLRGCTSTLRANGHAPTTRLRPVESALTSACKHYTAVGTLLTRGIDKASARLVRESTQENELAAPYLAKAVRLLTRIKVESG
jgi:hypothetical protein